MNPNATAAFPAYAHAEIHWTILNFTPYLLHNHRFTKHDSKNFTMKLSSGETTDWTFSMIRRQSCVSLYLNSQDIDADDLAALNFKVGAQLDGESKVEWLCEGGLGDWSPLNKLGRLFNFKELAQNYQTFCAFARKLTIVVRLEVIACLDHVASLPATMADQFESLMDNQDFGNFNMIASDGKRFLVNRGLLAARSKVFEAMLAANMIENRSNQVKMPDMAGPALEEFLRFVYCGKLEHLDEFAEELLGAAEKYDVSDLKPLCESALAHKISFENAVETLILADMHNAADLKKFCFEFIVWNRNHLEGADVWKHVPDELFQELLDATLGDNQNMEEILEIESNITVDFLF